MTSVQERIFDVRGTRAVVTGAASGLGFAMAEVLAECGARVTLADVDEERLAASTEALRSRGSTCARSSWTSATRIAVQALFDDVVEAQGGVDVVFANAGLAAVPGFRFDDGQTFDTIERSDWDQVLGVNLNGVMHTMRSATARDEGAGLRAASSSPPRTPASGSSRWRATATTRARRP